MNEYTELIIWVVVIGGLFAFLWWKGVLAKIARYVGETREELRKCTWPTKDELIGSTIVVLITTAMLGIFTVIVDFVVLQFVKLLTS